MTLDAQDRLDLIDLVVSYADRIDAGDAEGFAALYAPDAVLETRSGTANGRAEVKEWVETLFRERRAGPGTNVKHFISPPHVQGDGDRATLRTQVLIPALGNSGQIVINIAATYRDECVKLDGRWYFAKRKIDIEFTSDS